ncbi:zinc-binding dehydrogenase [Stieleria varia]|uniref:Sorbitol dehydrogenase n=1 Tax=Stieleria varia TaxID=2528005 RepID=A0A5C6B076_9BACT|nr:zinc-binding dehydrogenase [Stieleria varia]TWU04686.1 Sorbitol dehydrogenase [Stieleria varia]
MTPFTVEFDSESRTFHRREIPEPSLRPGEILIRVTCCTICGSDLHTYNGRRGAPADCVLGHEIIGEIVQWSGSEAINDFHGKPIRVGQRVTWAMAVGCNECFFCRNNLSQKCESLFKYGHESGGNHQRCSGPTGGLSNYCVLIPGTPLIPVPDSLTDEVAAPANCATATVCAAIRMIKETHAIRDATLLIVGAGMLGLNAIAQVCEAGASQIVIADPSGARADQARAFGATHCIHSGDQSEIESVLKSITNGRGADITMDFAGVKSAVETCIAAVRIGGCVLLAGSVFPSADIPISPEFIVRRILTIRGLHNYLPIDLDSALQFLDRTVDRFPFADLVTNTFSLTEAQAAFDYANKHRPIRVAVKPERKHVSVEV